MLFFSSARAEAYKEDGNYEYKRKNFKEAITAYTEGIKIKCDDAGLNAILYTNRATAQFCLGISQMNQIIIYFQGCSQDVSKGGSHCVKVRAVTRFS